MVHAMARHGIPWHLPWDTHTKGKNPHALISKVPFCRHGHLSKHIHVVAPCEPIFTWGYGLPPYYNMAKLQECPPHGAFDEAQDTKTRSLWNVVNHPRPDQDDYFGRETYLSVILSLGVLSAVWETALPNMFHLFFMLFVQSMRGAFAIQSIVRARTTIIRSHLPPCWQSRGTHFSLSSHPGGTKNSGAHQTQPPPGADWLLNKGTNSQRYASPSHTSLWSNPRGGGQRYWVCPWASPMGSHGFHGHPYPCPLAPMGTHVLTHGSPWKP